MLRDGLRDGRYFDTEQATVFFDTKEPVPLEVIGHFLTTIGKEIRSAYGEGFVIELVDVQHGSIGFVIEKLREIIQRSSGNDEHDRRLRHLEDRAIDRDRQLLELAYGLGRREEQIRHLKDRLDRQEKRFRERDQEEERNRRQVKLLTVITIALATPPAAAAIRDLLEIGKGQQVRLTQNNELDETIVIEELEEIILLEDEKRRQKKSKALLIEDNRLRERLEDGRIFELAGKVMPRKKATFQTVKGNQYRILHEPDEVPKGVLVVMHARAESGPNGAMGLHIFEVRPIDDR